MKQAVSTNYRVGAGTPSPNTINVTYWKIPPSVETLQSKLNKLISELDTDLQVCPVSLLNLINELKASQNNL